MKDKRGKGRGTTLRQYLRGEMKDPEFRRLYQEADVELRVALEITKAREDYYKATVQEEPFGAGFGPPLRACSSWCAISA